MKRRKDPSQQPLPFGDPPADGATAPPSRRPSHAETVRYQPSQEALAAIDRLEAWLADQRTGRMSPLGQEAMHALRQSLVEGKKGWIATAEDLLDALVRRNGLDQGDDIPTGQQPLAGPDFQESVEDVFAALCELGIGRGR